MLTYSVQIVRRYLLLKISVSPVCQVLTGQYLRPTYCRQTHILLLWQDRTQFHPYHFSAVNSRYICVKIQNPKQLESSICENEAKSLRNVNVALESRYHLLLLKQPSTIFYRFFFIL